MVTASFKRGGSPFPAERALGFAPDRLAEDALGVFHICDWRFHGPYSKDFDLN